MRTSGLHAIRSIIADERRSVRTWPVADGRPDWRVVDGRLANREADYFSVVAKRGAAGRSTLMLHQCEAALTALLVTRRDGETLVLLSVRSEPGLPGVTCMSSTIQSTPANYQRRHGGRATPYLDLVMGSSRGRVLHASEQFDWGDAYDGKVKEFVVVEVDAQVEADPGFVWVTLESARQLLGTDHLITSDLRACMMLLIASLESGQSLQQAAQPAASRPARCTGDHSSTGEHALDVQELGRRARGRDLYVDDHGNEVGFHRTVARSREVSTWVQPLLRMANPRSIALYRTDEDEPRYAVGWQEQPGSLGLHLASPRVPSSKMTGAVHRVATGAEGGRFLRHHIMLALVTVAGRSAANGPWPDGTAWLTERELMALMLQPLATSLELRLSLSLCRAIPGTIEAGRD